MKKYICISLLASLHVMNCFSQDISGFSTFNNIQLNPAYAGEDGKHAFNLAADINTGGGTPQAYEFAYTADIPKIKSGAGLFASLLKIGLEDYYKTGVIYDYNFKINENSNLRLGIQFNMLFVKQEQPDFIFNDPYDPAFHASRTVTKFNISPAVWYKLKEFNIGFTTDNLLKDEWHPHDYCLVTYYNFRAGEKVKITPSFTGIYVDFVSNHLTMENFQLHAEFSDRLIVAGGINYSQHSYSSKTYSKTGLMFNLGVKPAKFLLIMLGYSEVEHGTYFTHNVSALLKVTIK